MGEDIMDYTDRCRLCIAGSKRLSIDIFSPEGKRSKLQSKISKYLSLKVSEDDKLPSSICYQCLFRLETWVSFKKHCSDSDQTLKNWAFFCGAITPESYLNEANKSSENGSDVEKASSYFSSKDNDARARHRTPAKSHEAAAPGPGLSHTPSQTVSPSASVPLSSSSSHSSQRRGSESNEKSASKTNERSPLNGVTRAASMRPSKSGRRKILRPTKAFSSSRGDEHQFQLISVERKIQVSQAGRKSEDDLPNELRQEQTPSTLTLPFKRKRGRPSKAWLRERAEALKKLKEAAQTQHELSPVKDQKEEEEQDEPKELRDFKDSKNLKESKDFKKESRDFKKEPRDLQTRNVESKDFKKESRDFKKEPRDLQTRNVESKDPPESRDVKECREPKERKEPKSSKAMTEMIELNDPDFGSMKFTLSVIDSATVTSEKTVVYPESSTSVSSGRLSSDSCLKEEFSGFPNIEIKRAQDESTPPEIVEDIVADGLSEPCINEISVMPLSPQKPDRKRSHSALGHRLPEESEEKIKKLEVTSRSLESLKAADNNPIAITALPCHSPDHFKTEEDESDGEQVIGDETNLVESCVQLDVEPLEDDSDSDFNGPPMSPLSPPRINFDVIELGEMEDTDNDRSDNCEY